jgi:hypothetical protein
MRRYLSIETMHVNYALEWSENVIRDSINGFWVSG